MVRNRMLRVEDDVWEEFQKVSGEEGRFLGKMLEILVQAYKKQQEVREDAERMSEV